MAQMDNIDEELAKPFKEALQVELKRRLGPKDPGQSYTSEGGTNTGAATFTLFSRKGKEVGGDIELTMIIAARSFALDRRVGTGRARREGLWSGLWNSQWRTLFEPGQADAAQLLGTIEFTSHYAEDGRVRGHFQEGNVHFRRRVECRKSISETKDPERFAKQVVQEIQGEEEAFHEHTEGQCDSLLDGALRSFRRALPVSNERFDWRPLRHALVRDMKALGKDGGVEKSAAALSDIAVECQDPTSGVVPYSKEIQPGRSEVVLAACLNNIGQAITYIAKIGYQLNSLATSPGVCPKYPTTYERYVCLENIGSLLADLGQVATYISAAASGCGSATLPSRPGPTSLAPLGFLFGGHGRAP
eukprot:g24774.t2